MTAQPIQNNQRVKKGDILFEIDPRTFQATVNFARAELDNMRDIVESFAKQVEGLRHTVEERQSELNQVRFEVEGVAATTEDARIIYERAKELRVVNVNAQRDVDNRFAEYQVARARLSEARSKVNQMIAAHAQAEADLGRGLANLGTPGEDNARLRRAAANLELAQLNLGLHEGPWPRRTDTSPTCNCAPAIPRLPINRCWP